MSCLDKAEGIGIIGTGRMAQALGAVLVQCGVSITAVAGRNRERTLEALRFIGQGEPCSIRDVTRYSCRVLIAVSDDAIGNVASEILSSETKPEIAVHTSGAAGPEALAALQSQGVAAGVLHPLQTVPTPIRGRESLPGSTFAIAGDREAVQWAADLVRAIGGRSLLVPADGWAKYHAAAVMVSNHYVALVDAALSLLEDAGVGRQVGLESLRPLIQSTAENVARSGPEFSLTGPIRRGDAGTVAKHMAALATAAPDIKELYIAASRRALKLTQRLGIPHSASQALEEILYVTTTAHE